MSEPTTTLSVKLPAAVKSRLDRLSQSTSKSRSSLATDALTSYLDLYEWQVSEIREGLREADAGELASEKDVEAVFEKWTGEG